MEKFTDLLGSIFVVAAGVAIVAVLVSRNSNTASVLQSWFSGNANLLATAEAPVTGATANPNLSYAQSAASSPFGDLNGQPNFGAGFPNT